MLIILLFICSCNSYIIRNKIRSSLEVKMVLKSEIVGIERTLSEYISQKKPVRVEGYIKLLLEDFHVHEIDTEGRVLNLGKTYTVTQVKRAVESKKISKTGQNFLTKYEEGKVDVDYPNKLLTELDRHRINRLLFRLTERVKRGSENSEEDIPFTLVVCKDSEDMKGTRKNIHNWIRENLPFLESKTVDVSKCKKDENYKEHLGSYKDFSTLPEEYNLIQVQPTQLCVKYITNKNKNVDLLEEGSESEDSVTLDEMIKELDKTDYTDYNPKSYGKYLHFNVMKINRETSEVVQMICRSAKRASFDIFTAGNKDKRGITVQKICIRRCNIEQMLEAMTRGWYNEVYMSDFCYKNTKLGLGDLRGNHFKIVIRGVKDPGNIEEATETLKRNGFINYFGLQRFGTKMVGTHIIGASIIDQRYDLTLRLILGDIDTAKNYTIFNRYYENMDEGKSATNRENESSNGPKAGEGVSEEVSLGSTGTVKYKKATDYYLLDNDAETALKYIPMRLFVEKSILKGIAASLSNEKCLEKVPKNILSIYVHSTQSLLFNLAATERLNRYGLKVVPGDLVVTREEELNEGGLGEEYEENKEKRDKRITVIEVNSEEEASRYTIDQLVLPLPGDNIEYPKNMKDYYEQIAKDNFNMPLENFKTNRQKEGKNSKCIVSVGGSYRFIIVKPKDLSYEIVHKLENPLKVLIKPEVKEYEEEKESYGSERNMDRITQIGDLIKNRSAVILKCSLPKSSYITVALREILKDESIENNHG